MPFLTAKNNMLFLARGILQVVDGKADYELIKSGV